MSINQLASTIPPLDDMGLLPEGIWDCDLYELKHRFCTNPRRQFIWDGFERFMQDEVLQHAPLQLWVDGGYTRRRDFPDDIDVVLDFSHLSVAEAIPLIVSLYVRRNDLKEKYRVDAWGRHPAMPQDFAGFFQYAGPKAAVELHIDERHKKGILRVQL